MTQHGKAATKEDGASGHSHPRKFPRPMTKEWEEGQGGVGAPNSDHPLSPTLSPLVPRGAREEVTVGGSGVKRPESKLLGTIALPGWLTRGLGVW